MPDMSLSDLAEQLRVTFGECSSKFEPHQFEAMLVIAANDLARYKPTERRGRLLLIADQRDYAAPADMLMPRRHSWGRVERGQLNPWDVAYPKRLPTFTKLRIDGVDSIEIDPPPTAAQIAALGEAFDYTYSVSHTLSDEPSETTVPASQRDLLLLRALAEGMRQLAARGVSTPVSLGAGGNNRPKNGAPASLADQFMDDFIAGCRA